MIWVKSPPPARPLAASFAQSSNPFQIVKPSPIINFHLADCMDFMRGLPDKAFELAIVDPPYGIGQNWTKDRKSKYYKHRNTFNNVIPDKDYFDELFRVSKYQIIWGCNYYWNFLNPSNNIIFWDKSKNAFTQFGSAGELAWTSIKDYPLVKVDLIWNGCCLCEKTEKVHPHQKPVALYRWLLENYAKPGDRILDTHGGSGSIAIACHDLGHDLDIIELDPDYHAAALARYQRHVQRWHQGMAQAIQDPTDYTNVGGLFQTDAPNPKSEIVNRKSK
jgi:site-specific DNA-methyltransferase (adenine-specific)